MFTGLIESRGRVVDNQVLKTGRRLMIESDFDDIQVGESLAVNGVCLTVLPKNPLSSLITFDLSIETVSVTTLGDLVAGQSVNLERALVIGERMGGHYVSGHVDTTAVVQSVRVLGDFVEMVISDFSLCASPYLWPKGSITLDGVSLTINAVENESLTVMLIPHTLALTTLGSIQAGARMNVEFDYFAHIIAHQVGLLQKSQKMPDENII